METLTKKVKRRRLKPNTRGMDMTIVSTEETQSLISTNPLTKHISNTVLSANETVKTRNCKITQIALTVFLSLLSYAATYPMIEASLDYGEGGGDFKHFQADASAVGVFIAYGSLAAWGIAMLLNVIFTGKTKEEEKFISKSSTVIKVATVSSSVVLGGASRLALAGLSMNFTNSKFWPIFAPIATVAVPIYSVYMLLNGVINKGKKASCCINEHHKEIEQFRGQLLTSLKFAHIQQTQVEPHSELESKYSYLINGSGDVDDSIGPLDDDAMVVQGVFNQVMEAKKNCERKTVTNKTYINARRVNKFLTWICTTSVLAFNALLANDALKKIISNEGASYFLGALSSLPMAPATYSLSGRGADRHFDLFLRKWKDEYEMSFIEKKFPKYHYLLSTLSGLIGIICYPKMVAITDQFMDNDVWYEEMVTGVASYGLVTMLAQAIFEVIQKLSIMCINKYGKKQTSVIIKNREKLEKIMGAINSAEPEFIDNMITELGIGHDDTELVEC